MTTTADPEAPLDPAPVATVEEECAFWQKRLQQLTEIWQGVRAERDIAMYRLHQRGVSHDQIARWADESVGAVEEMLAIAAHDDNMAHFLPGPLWREFWPS